MNSEPFFRYARERYRILLAKNNHEPQPWTKDPVLQKFRFCNIFREDDRNTIWLRENYRDANKYNPNVILGVIIFRWFNKIETGNILLTNELLDDWNSTKAKQLLKDQPIIFTGAYIINSPYGMSKLDGICQCIDRLMSRKNELITLAEDFLAHPEKQSMRMLHKKLMEFERLGPFMAYEIVTDLRYTGLLEHAEDRLTWANPGPGAVRGLCRLNGYPIDSWNRHSQAHAETLQINMRELLADSEKEVNWPQIWPKWEMREVEHTLCEFDKWDRVHKNEGRMKQTYIPITI